MLITVAIALAGCVSAQAQGQRMRTRVISAPAGTRVIRTSGASASTVRALGGSLAPAARSLTGNSAEQLLQGDYPVPGLGFDYVHHAAVNRNLAARALIDPVTQQRLALERDLRRNTSGSPVAAVPVVVNSIVINVVPQPPLVIVQEAEPEPEDRRLEALAGASAAPGRSRLQGGDTLPPYEPPLREADELVLIRRDGGLLFAVAFTVRPDPDGPRLVYITREGHRRSVALDEIDREATRDMNEARGTSLHLQ